MESLPILKETNYEKIEKIVERLKTTTREIFIFPSGGVGKNLLETMRQWGITVTGLGDNSPQKVGKCVSGLPVVSFDHITEKHKDALILIGTRIYANEITEQFIGAGFAPDDIIFEEFNGFAALSTINVSDILRKNTDKLHALLPLLADETSKQVLFGYLNYLQTLDRRYIEEIRSTETMYFDRTLFALSEQESVVDGGGYIGDTFEVFQNLVPSFREYFLCEPMPEVMEQAKKRLDKLPGSDKIRFIQKALWNTEETLFFDSHGSGSAACQKGNAAVLADQLDHIVQSQNITLIKLDVEGSEACALNGARQTILRYHPKLAVCVYHLNNMMENGGFDILDLPLAIHELDSSYRLYLRHYGRGLTDTVCYAL